MAWVRIPLATLLLHVMVILAVPNDLKLSELDWLVTDPSMFPVPTFTGPEPCGSALLGGAAETPCFTLSNGLITRTFAALEDGGFGTIALIGEPSLFRGPLPIHVLRALSPEAEVSLDGVRMRIGALKPAGSPWDNSSAMSKNGLGHGLYLNRSSLAVETLPRSWRLANVSTSGAVPWPPGTNWTARSH